MTSRYQETVAEKLVLKGEVAKLEEALMAATSAPPLHHSAQELLAQVGTLALETATEVRGCALLPTSLFTLHSSHFTLQGFHHTATRVLRMFLAPSNSRQTSVSPPCLPHLSHTRSQLAHLRKTRHDTLTLVSSIPETHIQFT
jgi:hypothetical protein